jgi:hypothetical protein
MRTGLAFGALASVFLLSACETVATVTIDAEPDGSGLVTVVVELDEEASAALGDAPVLTDGLEDAGWETSQDSGSDSDPALRLSASKRYVDEEGLVAVMDEVGGSSGLFRGTFSEITEDAVETTYRAGTTVSVSGDPAQFSDEALAKLLDGLPLGRTEGELAFLGIDQPGAGTLTVQINAPGEGGSAESTFDLTSGVAEEAEVAATGIVEDTQGRRWIILGVAAAAVGLVLVVVGFVRWRQDRRRGTGDQAGRNGANRPRRKIEKPDD